jgi:hypothetical protein
MYDQSVFSNLRGVYGNRFWSWSEDILTYEIVSRFINATALDRFSFWNRVESSVPPMGTAVLKSVKLIILAANDKNA